MDKKVLMFGKDRKDVVFENGYIAVLCHSITTSRGRYIRYVDVLSEERRVIWVPATEPVAQTLFGH